MSENDKSMVGKTKVARDNTTIAPNGNTASTEPITILIGPNGSGKTTYIKNKIKAFGDPKGVFNLSSENITSLHGGKTNPFETEIKEIENKLIEQALRKELEDAEDNDAEITKKEITKKQIKDRQKAQTKEWLELNEDIKETIEKINTIDEENLIKRGLISAGKHSLTPNDDFGKNQFSIKQTRKINDTIISGSWVFRIGKEEVSIADAPSGVKKVLLLYFQIVNHRDKSASNKDSKLFVIEEIENYLHPSWIKICIFILKNIFDNIGKDEIIISTHSPEVIVLLGKYIKYFATPKDYGKDIERMDLDLAIEKYNRIYELVDKTKSPIKTPEYSLMIESILSFELGRFIFEKDSPVIICEGITDQSLIRNHTKSLVTNTFGYFNFPIYISMYFGLYKKYNENWRILADGDGKLTDPESAQAKFKDYFINTIGLRKENVFYFKKDLENDLYKCNCNTHANRKRVKGEEPAAWKFRLLREVGLKMNKETIKKNEAFYNFLFEV